MFGLGEHAAFIVASYAIVAAVLGGMLAWLVWAGSRAQQQLEALERSGVRRRQSRQGSGPDAGDAR